MAYVREWERLADALQRVVATGLREGEAKSDICNAIADRKIEVRFLVSKEEGGLGLEQVDGTVRNGREVDIPSHLKPKDFDWKRSRPLQPWFSSRFGHDVFAAEWHLKWLEVRRSDVSKVLCGLDSAPELLPKHAAQTLRQTTRLKKLTSPTQADGPVDNPPIGGSMGLPELAWLTPSEAADRVAADCGVSLEDARLRLERAFHDRELRLVDGQGHALGVRLDAVVDWDWGTLTWPPPTGDRKTVHTSVTHIRVNAAQLEEWMAGERSKANKKRFTELLFAEPFWPVYCTLGWIAFRDPLLIESSVKAAKLYDRTGMKERKPEQSLLRALKYDNLRAIRDGSELPREAWAVADGRHWPDVRFRREDVLALWPDLSSGAAGHLTFKDIAQRWGKLTGEPVEKMMAGLVSAFWRGRFEQGVTPAIFILLPPNGPPSLRGRSVKDRIGEYAYSSVSRDAVVRVDKDGEHRLTAERRVSRLLRCDVATVLGGTSDFIPWAWNKTEDGLLAYANVPYPDWPTRMQRAHFEKWRINRADFGDWYKTQEIWPTPPLNSMWPPSVENGEGEAVTAKSMEAAQVATKSKGSDHRSNDRIRPAVRRGPKSSTTKMRQALAKLYADKRQFRTKKEAYLAVLKECDISVAKPLRGWSEKTFHRIYFESGKA